MQSEAPANRSSCAIASLRSRHGRSKLREAREKNNVPFFFCENRGEFISIRIFVLIACSVVFFAFVERLKPKEISMTFTVKHISVSINRTPAQVYEFASNPENLPKWAAGLSGPIKKVDEDWISESPMGRVKIKFAEKNNFGVLDHV
jgi:hypothetical protein